MKNMVFAIALCIVACDGPRDETVERPAAAKSVADRGYPVKKPDGSPLTAAFCNSEKAQRIYDNLKTCSMVACDQGDRESCTIAKEFAIQHAPTSIARNRKLEGMDYMEARAIIHSYGWSPMRAECSGIDEATCLRFPEIGNCSGTGMGFCDMHFTRSNRCLSLVTVGGPPDSVADGEPSVRDVAFSRIPCRTDPNEAKN